MADDGNKATTASGETAALQGSIVDLDRNAIARAQLGIDKGKLDLAREEAKARTLEAQRQLELQKMEMAERSRLTEFEAGSRERIAAGQVGVQREDIAARSSDYAALRESDQQMQQERIKASQAAAVEAHQRTLEIMEREFEEARRERREAEVGDVRARRRELAAQRGAMERSFRIAQVVDEHAKAEGRRSRAVAGLLSDITAKVQTDLTVSQIIEDAGPRLGAILEASFDNASGIWVTTLPSQTSALGVPLQRKTLAGKDFDLLDVQLANGTVGVDGTVAMDLDRMVADWEEYLSLGSTGEISNEQAAKYVGARQVRGGEVPTTEARGVAEAVGGGARQMLPYVAGGSRMLASLGLTGTEVEARTAENSLRTILGLGLIEYNQADPKQREVGQSFADAVDILLKAERGAIPEEEARQYLGEALQGRQAELGSYLLWMRRAMEEGMGTGRQALLLQGKTPGEEAAEKREEGEGAAVVRKQQRAALDLMGDLLQQAEKLGVPNVEVSAEELDAGLEALREAGPEKATEVLRGEEFKVLRDLFPSRIAEIVGGTEEVGRLARTMEGATVGAAREGFEEEERLLAEELAEAERR